MKTSVQACISCPSHASAHFYSHWLRVSEQSLFWMLGNCEWKGCRKSFTHNKILNLTRLIWNKWMNSIKNGFSCLWISTYKVKYRNLFTFQKYHVAFLCADLSGRSLDLHSPYNQCSTTAETSFKTHYSSVILSQQQSVLSNATWSIFMFICLGLKIVKKKGFKIVP